MFFAKMITKLMIAQSLLNWQCKIESRSIVKIDRDNGLRGGHILRYCKSNSSCTIKGCSRKHHTLLLCEFISSASVRNRNKSHAPSTFKLLPETSRSVSFLTRSYSVDKKLRNFLQKLKKQVLFYVIFLLQKL